MGAGPSGFSVMSRLRSELDARVGSPVPHWTLYDLVIDDDPAVLKSTNVVLALGGHSVTVADGGQEGIDALRAAHQAGERFDAVITDLGMPYVDGNQVALTVKELFPATPVLLLTGWGRRMASGDKTKPPAHVDFVLPKPLDLDELREVFAQLA